MNEIEVNKGLQRVMKALQAKGADEGDAAQLTDTEVLLVAAWALLNKQQREAFLADDDVVDLLKNYGEKEGE